MNGMNVSPARAAICSAIEGHSAIHGGAGHLDAPQQGNGVELFDHEIRSDAPDVRAKHAHRRGHVELLEMQQCKMPSVMTMDRAAAGRQQWEE